MGKRAERVAESVRALLSEALVREIDDPRLSTLVITAVTLPDDLGLVRVTVRHLSGEASEAERSAVLRSLERAAPRLRRTLGPGLKLKRVPELKFYYDTGRDAENRVLELLDEIAREQR